MVSTISVKLNTLSYESKTVLENIELDVKAGEFVVLTGLSGSGKSSLLHCMNGLIPELYETKLDGEISIANKNLKDFKSGEIASYIGNVFQDPKDQFFSTCAEDEVAIVGENLGIDYDTLHNRVDSAFKDMDAEHLRHKSVYEMSGGQKQLIAITSTLVADTEILFLDEPSASLDFYAIQTAKEALSKLKAQGKTIVVAEHRLYYVKDLIDRLIILDKGKIIAELSQQDLTQKTASKYGLRSLDESTLTASQKALQSPCAIRVQNLSIQNKKSFPNPSTLTLSRVSV